MLPNHFTVEEMIYIPLTQAWFLLMKLMILRKRKFWALEFYVHNATDELIKTDSYPANAGFVKAMYAPPMAYGVLDLIKISDRGEQFLSICQS